MPAPELHIKLPQCTSDRRARCDHVRSYSTDGSGSPGPSELDRPQPRYTPREEKANAPSVGRYTQFPQPRPFRVDDVRGMRPGTMGWCDLLPPPARRLVNVRLTCTPHCLQRSPHNEPRLDTGYTAPTRGPTCNVHRNHKAYYGREPWTATSTFNDTWLLMAQYGLNSKDCTCSTQMSFSPFKPYRY